MKKKVCFEIMNETLFPTEPVHYAKVEFEIRRQRNPNYSVRAFARDLEISPSHLSDFLSGKSKLSAEKAKPVGQKLKLSGQHFEHWCDLLKISSRLKKERDGAKYRISQRVKNSQFAVSEKVYEAISDWHHFAILTFFGANSSFSLKEISQRLGISIGKVKASIQLLIEIQLLRKTICGGYQPTEDYSLVGDNVPSAAIRESHKQILKKSIKALDVFDMEDRESQSLFLSLPESQLKSFRQALRSKVLELASEYGQSNLEMGDVSVQALTLQLFPLKKVEK